MTCFPLFMACRKILLPKKHKHFLHLSRKLFRFLSEIYILSTLSASAKFSGMKSFSGVLRKCGIDKKPLTPKTTFFSSLLKVLPSMFFHALRSVCVCDCVEKESRSWKHEEWKWTQTIPLRNSTKFPHLTLNFHGKTFRRAVVCVGRNFCNFTFCAGGGMSQTVTQTYPHLFFLNVYF